MTVASGQRRRMRLFQTSRYFVVSKRAFNTHTCTWYSPYSGLAGMLGACGTGPADSPAPDPIGKTVEPCTQTSGSVDPTPRPGLPPNAVHNVALSCPGGGDRKHLLSVGTLLVTVAAGPDFNYDFEVPFSRDVKAG